VLAATDSPAAGRAAKALGNTESGHHEAALGGYVLPRHVLGAGGALGWVWGWGWKGVESLRRRPRAACYIGRDFGGQKGICPAGIRPWRERRHYFGPR
jgi:hypothetical protein